MTQVLRERYAGGSPLAPASLQQGSLPTSRNSCSGLASTCCTWMTGPREFDQVARDSLTQAAIKAMTPDYPGSEPEVGPSRPEAGATG